MKRTDSTKSAKKGNADDTDPSITFRIDQEKKDALAEAAERDHRDVSSLLRKLVDEYLERELSASK